MEFGAVIRSRREQLKQGVRETARMTMRPFVPQPILSPVYISRLENKVVEELRADAVSIDKLWALGVALRMQPLVLFAESRGMPELMDKFDGFVLRDCEACHLSVFLRGLRHGLGLTLRQVEARSNSVSPWGICTGYLSQLETNDQGLSERVQAEKLWALGLVLGVDPLLLYVLSRKIDARYLSSRSRDRLFS